MSALAARRAAQASGLTSSNPIVVETTVETTVIRTVSPTLSSDEGSGSEAGPSKRRKITKKQARYFAPEDKDEGVTRPTKRGNKRNRKFSPSAPASEAEDGIDSSDDSSAERDVDEGRADWTVPSTPRAEVTSTTTVMASNTAYSGSRFKVINGSNFHLLSNEVLTEYGVPGDGAGVVLSLTKHDVSLSSSPGPPEIRSNAFQSVMLGGIYTLLPLQGQIDLLSTTLSSSITTTPVPVFAPSSHPIPVITSSTSTTPRRVSLYLSKLPLPSTFQLGDSRTILLVREHECGLQGLRGGIVPGFSNIWGEDRGSWGLRSINPVSHSSIPITPSCHLCKSTDHQDLRLQYNIVPPYQP